MLSLLASGSVAIDTTLTDVLVDGSIRALTSMRLVFKNAGANPLAVTIKQSGDGSLYVPDYALNQGLADLQPDEPREASWHPFSGAYLYLQAQATGGPSTLYYEVWAATKRDYDFRS